VRQAATVWRAGGKAAQAAAQPVPVGTTFSFVLDQPATVRLRFDRARHGRKRARTAGTLSASGHPGANRLRFQGRISARTTLSPGAYTVTVTATNGAGQPATARPLRFRIVK
jgi:hypothetical protein